MDSNDINDLLERYRNDQCTAEEKMLLEQWFDSQSASGEWEWQSLEEKTTKTRIKNRINQKLFEKSFDWAPLLRIAAVLVLVMSSLFYYKTAIHNWVDPVVMIEKKVKEGETLQLTLADGTKVSLNGGTRLTYPDRFDQKKRQVYLVEGEAYFDVSHDPAHPFIVTSGQVDTKVLGTAFNIKAYSFLTSIKVAVTRGKVRVSNQKGDSTLVLPNQEVSVDKHTRRLDKRPVDANANLIWKQGGFAFNNDKLVDVCAVLAKKFHINFVYESKNIQDYRLTAGFEGTDQLNDILAILASANNLTFTTSGDTVSFKQR